MDSWRRVFRGGFSPLLSFQQLVLLRDALLSDDQRLLQGATCQPPPIQALADWPCEAACLFGYCGVVELGGFGKAVVSETEEFFARMAFDIDAAMGEPSACRFLLNWYDDTPRDEMRAELLPEVERELAARTGLLPETPSPIVEDRAKELELWE